VKHTVVTSSKLIEYFRMSLIYYQLVSGKGLEFDRIKEYAPGMDPKRIDWKKFAKTSKLYIRAFKEERHFDIIVVLDVSDSMLLGTTEFTKNQFASIIAGAIGFAAGEAGDLFAVAMYSDKVKVALDPTGDLFKVLNIVADKNNYRGNKDWLNLSTTLITNYDENSIIFIVSDFIDTNPEEFLPELAAHFSKVYGIMIRDPIDDELPRGVGRAYLKNVSGTDPRLVNFESAKEEYRLLNLRHIERIGDAFHKYDQLFFNLKTNEDFGTAFINALGAEEVIIY
ncbi:MAG: DUF58 domain-containing protein, partial [Candidatus Woesearchaeota archaeon]